MLLKILIYDKLVNKANIINLNNQISKKKIEDVDKKILGTKKSFCDSRLQQINKKLHLI